MEREEERVSLYQACASSIQPSHLFTPFPHFLFVYSSNSTLSVGQLCSIFLNCSQWNHTGGWTKIVCNAACVNRGRGLYYSQIFPLLNQLCWNGIGYFGLYICFLWLG
ncbi:hypothetical protein EAF00_001291 [Botryotinia globosa]|nr:hypothetical protein EAF00_001291 [Botryotinia globosa]